MKILKNLSGIVFTVAVMAMFGCGGSGSSTPAAPPPTTATLKLLSAGPVGTKIGSIEVTVVLPMGVTVKPTTSTINSAIQQTYSGVVVPSVRTSTANFDPRLTVSGFFTPATASAPGTVKVLIPAITDFELGEYVTINAVIAAGNFPKAEDFKLTGFTAVDLNGVPIAGVTSTIVTDIR